MTVLAFMMSSFGDNDNIIVGNNGLEQNLFTIRQPVWDFLAQTCPSFTNRDCDAQFSEIFSSTLFNLFTLDEQAFFQSKYILKAFCDNCNVPSSIETPIMINYISDNDLGCLENLHDWPNLLRPLGE